MRRCWRISRLTQPKKKKKEETKKSSALLYLPKASWLLVSADYLLPQLMHAPEQTQGGVVCPTPRGYLTNLFDVADPDTELPHSSAHCDEYTQTVPPPPPPPPYRAGFSQCEKATR